jgi:hypothetical protein
VLGIKVPSDALVSFVDEYQALSEEGENLEECLNSILVGEGFKIAIQDTDWFAECLNSILVGEGFKIAFQDTDWFADLESVIVYKKRYSTYGYTNIISVDPDKLSIENNGMNELAFENLLSKLKLPTQTPKWYLFAEYY